MRVIPMKANVLLRSLCSSHKVKLAYKTFSGFVMLLSSMLKRDKPNDAFRSSRKKLGPENLISVLDLRTP